MTNSRNSTNPSNVIAFSEPPITAEQDAAVAAMVHVCPEFREFLTKIQPAIARCPPGQCVVFDLENRFSGYVDRDEAKEYVAKAEAGHEIMVMLPEMARPMAKHLWGDTDWKTIFVGQLGEPYKRNHYGALQSRWRDGQEEVRTVPMGWHRSRAGAYEYAKEQGLLK